MTLTVAVQMDPIERIRIAGDFDLRASSRSPGARAQHPALHARPTETERHARRSDGRGAVGQGRRGRSRASWRAEAGRSFDRRCRAPAPRPAVRPCLYRDDAHSRAHPSENAGRQRSPRRARFARKAVRDGFPGAHAPDPHRPRQGGDRGVPRRAWRSGDEAALRLRRRIGVQGRRSGPQFRLAVRSVQHDAFASRGSSRSFCRRSRAATSGSFSSTAKREA